MPRMTTLPTERSPRPRRAFGRPGREGAALRVGLALLALALAALPGQASARGLSSGPWAAQAAASSPVLVPLVPPSQGVGAWRDPATGEVLIRGNLDDASRDMGGNMGGTTGGTTGDRPRANTGADRRRDALGGRPDAGRE